MKEITFEVTIEISGRTQAFSLEGAHSLVEGAIKDVFEIMDVEMESVSVKQLDKDENDVP